MKGFPLALLKDTWERHVIIYKNLFFKERSKKYENRKIIVILGLQKYTKFFKTTQNLEKILGVRYRKTGKFLKNFPDSYFSVIFHYSTFHYLSCVVPHLVVLSPLQYVIVQYLWTSKWLEKDRIIG